MTGKLLFVHDVDKLLCMIQTKFLYDLKVDWR